MSSNDFKLKMSLLKSNRSSRTDDISAFNQLRQAFSDITDKYANQRTNSTLRSSIGNRVTFKQDVVVDQPGKYQGQNFANPILSAVLPSYNDNNSNGKNTTNNPNSYPNKKLHEQVHLDER